MPTVSMTLQPHRQALRRLQPLDLGVIRQPLRPVSQELRQPLRCLLAYLLQALAFPPLPPQVFPARNQRLAQPRHRRGSHSPVSPADQN